jgi:hypothetical protein
MSASAYLRAFVAPAIALLVICDQVREARAQSPMELIKRSLELAREPLLAEISIHEKHCRTRTAICLGLPRPNQ